MLRIAVIGCGQWGSNHLRVFNFMKGCRLVAAADPDAARRKQTQELYPHISVKENYADILKDPEVDAVVVATPATQHYAVASVALKAGKHVLCEKPLCVVSKEAEDLVEIARMHKRILMVGHVFVFNDGIQKMGELIKNKEMGQLYYLSAVRTNLGPIRADINAAYDLASHDIAIFNWLLGSKPESVSASGHSFIQPGIEDVVFITLRYPNNVIGTIEVSWLNPKKVRQITVVGSRKMVTWDDLEVATPIAVYDKGAAFQRDFSSYGEFLRVSMWEGDVRLVKVTLNEPLRNQAQHFLEAIRSGKVDSSDGSFGVDVVRVLEAVSKSSNSQGQFVTLNGAAPVKRS